MFNLFGNNKSQSKQNQNSNTGTGTMPYVDIPYPIPSSNPPNTSSNSNNVSTSSQQTSTNTDTEPYDELSREIDELLNGNIDNINLNDSSTKHAENSTGDKLDIENSIAEIDKILESDFNEQITRSPMPENNSSKEQNPINKKNSIESSKNNQNETQFKEVSKPFSQNDDIDEFLKDFEQNQNQTKTINNNPVQNQNNQSLNQSNQDIKDYLDTFVNSNNNETITNTDTFTKESDLNKSDQIEESYYLNQNSTLKTQENINPEISNDNTNNSNIEGTLEVNNPSSTSVDTQFNYGNENIDVFQSQSTNLKKDFDNSSEESDKTVKTNEETTYTPKLDLDINDKFNINTEFGNNTINEKGYVEDVTKNGKEDMEIQKDTSNDDSKVFTEYTSSLNSNENKQTENKIVQEKVQDKEPDYKTYLNEIEGSLDTCAFVGLNTKQTIKFVSDSLRIAARELSKKGYKINIDSNKGYGLSVVDGCRDTENEGTEINLTGFYLKPFFSSFSDQIDLFVDINNYTYKLYSNIFEKTKDIITESNVFIVPEINTINNYMIFFSLLNLSYLYKNRSKHILIFGRGWQAKVKEIFSIMKIDEQSLENFYFCTNLKELFETIVMIEKNNKTKKSLLIPKIIDNREADSEKKLVL